MRIKSSALSLTVADVNRSGQFLREHLGFEEKFSADGFAYLAHPDAGMDIVFLRIGMKVLPKHMHTQKAEGIIVPSWLTTLKQRKGGSEAVASRLPSRFRKIRGENVCFR